MEPSKDFKTIIDQEAQKRKQTKPQLTIADETGKTMPFDQWARQWVTEAIDGHKTV